MFRVAPYVVQIHEQQTLGVRSQKAEGRCPPEFRFDFLKLGQRVVEEPGRLEGVGRPVRVDNKFLGPFLGVDNPVADCELIFPVEILDRRIQFQRESVFFPEDVEFVDYRESCFWM